MNIIDDDDAIIQFIRDRFEENLAVLQLEGGHALAPEVKESARNQVLLYWRKLRDVAERITDTEVKLSLPGQYTPQGREFCIEGVVDIIRDNDRTVMYDVKTHDADVIEADKGSYEAQLNVYAHIWQNLRGQQLDATAIICTAYPLTMREALRENDDERMEFELARWNPLIDIPFSEDHVQQTITEFGKVVDQIEGRDFAPPALERLKGRLPGMNTVFAVHVCRNCDARFSCAAYRDYARGSRGGAESRFRQYLDDFGDDAERTDRIVSGLGDAS